MASRSRRGSVSVRISVYLWFSNGNRRFLGSANARELLAAGHVEDALGTDGALEQHAGGALVGNFPNPARTCATGMGAHNLQRALRLPLGYEGGEPPLASHLQGIEAEDLTRRADVFANGDELFLDVDGKVGGFGDFV